MVSKALDRSKKMLIGTSLLSMGLALRVAMHTAGLEINGGPSVPKIPSDHQSEWGSGPVG